jgi:2-phospho-L-lactate guanylyltransferase
MPQGTVKSFNPATSTGVLLDDTLAEHPVDKEAFVASGLMELRIGQRVRFELEDTDDGQRVTQLNIVTL